MLLYKILPEYQKYTATSRVKLKFGAPGNQQEPCKGFFQFHQWRGHMSVVPCTFM